MAVAAVAQGGTIVHMDRKDSDDGKVRPQSMIYAQDEQFRMDTLDAAGHVRDFVLVRDGNIWQVDMEKRTFMQIDRAALSGKQSEMQDRMQAMLQSLPPEKRAAMEARMQGVMAGRSQPPFTMTDTGKSDQVGSWSCEIWQVSRGGTVSSDACIASRGVAAGRRRTRRCRPQGCDDRKRRAVLDTSSARDRAAYGGLWPGQWFSGAHARTRRGQGGKAS